jgi:hypothetical protein
MVVWMSGCDRAPAPAPPVKLPGKSIVRIKPITQLPPNRNVHLAVDASGNIVYAVETDNGLDGMLVVGQDGVPRATQLTSSNILAAMGESSGGSGAIQDLVGTPDGAIFFYFVGGKGRTIRACLGRFVPRNQSLSILVEAPYLARASHMGDSIELARATLLQLGQRVGLFLRHSDAWAYFSFDSLRIAPHSESELKRGFTKVMVDDQELKLSQSRYDLAPGPDSDLLLLDRQTGTLLQVNPAGVATIRSILTGLPRDLSAPFMVAADHLLFFAADSEPVEADGLELARRVLPPISYPALVQIKAREISAFSREDFRAPASLPVFAMRIHELIAGPDGTFIAYDAASGQLVEMKITNE